MEGLWDDCELSVEFSTPSEILQSDQILQSDCPFVDYFLV
jgi:hypothetical protein